MQFKKIKDYKIPLKWSMIWMLVMGWLLPLMIIGFCLLYFVSNMISFQVEKTIRISADKATEICEMHLTQILLTSKEASYNTTIRDSYTDYMSDSYMPTLKSKLTYFLNKQYKYDINLLCTVLFFLDEPEGIFYTYNSFQEYNGGVNGYSRVQNFSENVLERVKEQSPELDTRTMLYEHSNRLFMVRNLVDASFNPYAMLAVEISPEYVFESLESIWGAKHYEIYIDETPILNTEMLGNISLEEVRSAVLQQNGYIHDNRGAFACRIIDFEDQEIICLVELDSNTLIDDVAMLRWVLVLVLVFMIPLMIIIFLFFHDKVTKPISKLVSVSKEIGSGNYGQVVENTANSQEFESLNNAINAMSTQLKYQFEKIYLEELALKDANIKALQAQINPHFLNNTLEIINWEARMQGNEKVCKMSEALATMLNATMNRGRRRYITLAEEMEYVNAYLYIIKQRTGERFKVIRDIDSNMLNYEVPLLIIQPIVENAVEHGMRGKKEKEITIHIYKQDDMMYIEVINNGALSQRDKERIDYLLGDEVQEDTEQHISLGIRNVNRRCKIIYGEDCGLTIVTNDNNQTISTIKVRASKNIDIN